MARKESGNVTEPRNVLHAAEVFKRSTIGVVMKRANRQSRCLVLAVVSSRSACALPRHHPDSAGFRCRSPRSTMGGSGSNQAPPTPPSAGIRRGAIAAAFNEVEADPLLQGIIKSNPRSEVASQAHELLSRIYLRSGRYKRLIDNLDRWAASFPNRPEVQKEKADLEQFRGLPDQRNDRRRVSTLRHAADDWAVPVSINGQPATYVFDSGAWLSVMTESEATRLGLEIRQGAGTLGDPSGKGVAVRTAVARDVRIGAMRMQNVSFAVLANEGPWSSLPPAKEAFSGFRSGFAIGHVRWSSRGTWELGGQSESATKRHETSSFSKTNCCWRRMSPAGAVFGTLDTGAIGTDLNENFADEFAALVEGGSRQTRDITGLEAPRQSRQSWCQRCHLRLGRHGLFFDRRMSHCNGQQRSAGRAALEISVATSWRKPASSSWTCPRWCCASSNGHPRDRAPPLGFWRRVAGRCNHHFR